MPYMAITITSITSSTTKTNYFRLEKKKHMGIIFKIQVFFWDRKIIPLLLRQKQCMSCG